MAASELDWSWNPWARPERSPAPRGPGPSAAAAFHGALGNWGPTPLHPLDGLARELGLRSLHLKDEAHRFGLNAFKVLGASWGVFRALQQRFTAAGLPPLEAPRPLESGERAALRELAIVAATEGNHGRAIAWSAARFGLPAVIFMRDSADPARVAACEREGATVVRVPGDYDAAVAAADQAARQHGWALVGDQGYPGYLDIPRDIAEGYRTLFQEVDAAAGPEAFSVLVIQAGVGGLATAAALHAARPGGPALVVVEPREADGLLASARSPDGALTRTRHGQRTKLAGLNCATPSHAAWPVLRASVSAFTAIDDGWAVAAVGRLSEQSPRIEAGLSGAAGLGMLLALRESPGAAPLRERLFGPDARVLVVNTEAPLGA